MPLFRGTIVEGKKAARGLGYPTANLAYESATAPNAGVWTCRATMNGKTFNGLAVIDMWKLSNGLPSLEVHLLDFSEGDIYGQEMDVEIKTKLRDLVLFSSVPDLVEQIKKDIDEARRIFAGRV